MTDTEHTTCGSNEEEGSVSLLALSIVVDSLQFDRLFVKLPRSGDSKVTFTVFESSCHLLLPV